MIGRSLLLFENRKKCLITPPYCVMCITLDISFVTVFLFFRIVRSTIIFKLLYEVYIYFIR